MIAILEKLRRLRKPVPSTEVPWVMRGEFGLQILTKWEDDVPVGFEPWCGTCGWHGEVQRFVPGAPNDHAQWQAALDESRVHLAATGHQSEG